MSETTLLSLPLLMPAQAQKHVTVNEALLRIDALLQMTLASRTMVAPPPSAPEGTCYSVPEGAAGAWAGRAGSVAVWLNGGWEFITPAIGWRTWIADEGSFAIFDGQWSQLAGGSGGAPAVGPALRGISFDHAVTAGTASTTAPQIPGSASVWGVTGRVVEAIGGATAFSIGIAGSEDRYGSGIGTAAGSWLRGLTGSPLTYWSDTPLVLTSEDADFDGTGVLRLVVYAVELPLPA